MHLGVGQSDLVAQAVHCTTMRDDIQSHRQHTLWRRIQKASWRRQHLRDKILTGGRGW